MLRSTVIHVAYGSLVAFFVAFISVAQAQMFLPTTPPALPDNSSSSASSVQQRGSIVNNESLETLSKKEYQPKFKGKYKSNSNADAPYDPSHPDLTKVYSFSNKAYSPAVDAVDQHALLKLPLYQGKPFVNDTKPLNYGSYSGEDAQTSLYHNKTFPAANAYPTSGATGVKGSVNYSKSFSVPAKPLYGNENDYPTNEALAYNHKAYDGPEAQIAKEEMKRVSKGLSGLKDIPSRPLSIDEVKDLLNKGHSPSQDSPSDDSSEDARPSRASLPDAPADDVPPLQNRPDDSRTSDPQMPGPGEMATPLPPTGSSPANYQAVDPASGRSQTSEPLPQ